MQEKKIILMIHGMWCGKWVWEHMVKYFEEFGYICMPINLKYHDAYFRNSHASLGTTSIQEYVDEVIEAAKAIHKQYGRYPIIFGHSMGGLIALIVGSRGFAESLILLAPAAPRWVRSLESDVISCFFRMMTDQWAFWRKPIKPTYAEAKLFLFPNLSESEKKKAYNKLCYESGKAAFEIGMWFFYWEITATKVEWEKLSCPILFCVGDNDLLTPPVVVKRTFNEAQKVLGDKTEFMIFSGKCHWLLNERDVKKKVASWLSLTNA